MDLMRTPEMIHIVQSLNRATAGNLLDFAGFCRMHNFKGTMIVQTEGLPSGVVGLHLHAANQQGRTTHFESYWLRGSAAASAAQLRTESRDLVLRTP